MAADPPPRRTPLVGHDAALSSLLSALLAEIPGPAGEAAEQAATRDQRRPPGLKAGRHKPLDDRAVDLPARPSWAASAFRVLLFGIGGYRFALPLIRMRSVALLPEDRVRLPGQPSWHLGVTRLRGGQVLMVDLGLLVGIEARCSAARYLLVVGDGNVALVCDRIDDAALVRPEQVRWRRRGGGGAWLAGLLSEAMCVLLDADAIAAKVRHG